jgi:acyl-CoA oxidase
MENDTFTINTPTISAAKYWPGDLGIFATHALVFAQMIVHGKNHGVHAFIVPIRDMKTLKPLPGIEAGDIGPKIGFDTKDNGYLFMKNISIPKSNMLRRFVSVSKTGEIKTKGDPKVSYATMMVIRQAISCFQPKTYSMGIIIAARYSLFRSQFLDSAKKEIPIIDYQTQKEKIITRVAEYFAVMTGGNAIKKISD